MRRNFAENSMSRRLRLLTGAFLAGLAVPSFAADTPPALPSAICGTGAAKGAPTTIDAWAKNAQFFDGLGDFHRKVTTSSPEAQRYFDQGMRLLWAFNHDESTRSFAAAGTLDPDCALCWWGVALTVGPNYNFPEMAAPRAKIAWEALQRAEQAAATASPVEQALIAALAKRYTGPEPLDPSNEIPNLTGYAEAMKQVAAKFPDDADVATLTAEAMMNINAWKLWTLDGKPAPGTEEIIARLLAVMAKHPDHPGANHYYVHAVEASPHPEQGVAAAEKLRGMMPAAGHLEHMPAHILHRVGRYEDSAEANRKGAAADLAYFAKATPPDYYAMYTAHNDHFLAFSAAMAGEKAETLAAAQALRTITPVALLLENPGSDWIVAASYSAEARFGAWDVILAEPAPDPKLHGLTAGWLYAQTLALAAKGRLDEARVMLAALDKLDVPAGEGAGLNGAGDILAIERLVARARLLAADGKAEEAVTALTEAVAREDKLAYDEPSGWFFPARHPLGAALLATGKPVEAEAVYREDLRRNPANGWSLFGLAKALEQQGKTEQAAAAKRDFDKAWSHADIALTASAF
jgi:tetratricopeptide (TPR) repeat protein